jgi:LCP family protein required for cell wall assembly
MEENTPKKGRIKRILLKVLVVFLAVLLLLVSAAMLYMNYLLNRINRNDPAVEHTVSSSEADAFLGAGDDLIATTPPGTETLPDINDITFPTEPQTTAPAVTVPAKPAPQIYGDHLVNIMLVGQDRREGEIRARSDTMILVSFNKSDNTITLTSFMRDMYVQIPGYKPNKLNAAYALGGFSLMNETLAVNFGVLVDGNVEVDFDGFKDVIDLLGGVEITLTQAEADHLNEEYQYTLTPGKQYLNGEQALSYSRIRKIDTDYQRAKRQRTVLISLLNRYKEKPAAEMLALLDDILPMVTTNMTNAEIIGIAMEVLPMLSSSRIDTLRIPVDGTFQQGDVQVRPGLKNWFQYNIDFEANRKLLQQIFAE